MDEVKIVDKSPENRTRNMSSISSKLPHDLFSDLLHVASIIRASYHTRTAAVAVIFIDNRVTGFLVHVPA
jgi:hypothetical protein